MSEHSVWKAHHTLHTVASYSIWLIIRFLNEHKYLSHLFFPLKIKDKFVSYAHSLS